MRNIGCCTWIFDNEPIEETARRVKDIGLNGVELHGNIHSIDPVQAGKIFADQGLQIFSITPGDADISHPDRIIRQDAVDYYKQLIDWVLKINQTPSPPLISCHGLVQRIRPVSNQEEENNLLVESIRQICNMARQVNTEIVFEVLNRYESHQVRTLREGLNLIEHVKYPNLRLLADAYHMNIEEANPAASLREAGEYIGLYHAADSNRGAIGEGHTDFTSQMIALNDIQYQGPIILEIAAPGPDPFNTNKGEGFKDILEQQLKKSVNAIRAFNN
ncbi:sugar phosphate isomerase/epimerase family protein [Commensalibacter communis]|uniref:sugar phosphate isomerase/epimerase family protein n=1 Tax=Commensalibacter communis TaxID=2972786 RepID=UPI0022FF7A59|nr:sugar phosphate isomerase/epimerase family protein [Commensalibacter communis]CAI3956848.1 Sugar phosphate isomerase/epimerase (YcjR) (PDB:3KTC) (PUBMED:30742415) [Commensalibacter communis]CAI3957790.1 Sugar phosphate isomerase/epimerase (YcjR) (PDB:3KTC) (PUBMED:30742415) [Commensalibacter communis]